MAGWGVTSEAARTDIEPWDADRYLLRCGARSCADTYVLTTASRVRGTADVTPEPDHHTTRPMEPEMTDQAEYYHHDNWGGRKCKPGNKHEPKRCDYHPEHFWCRTCEGFYGVPHDDIHEGPNKHPLDVPRNCACRPCMDLVASRGA